MQEDQQRRKRNWPRWRTSCGGGSWELRELAGVGRPPSGAGAASAAATCRWLTELLVRGGAAEPGPPSTFLSGADEADLPAPGGSPFGFVGARRLEVDSEARVRPPVPVRVDAAAFVAHPRVCSVLTRGLRVRVPS